eukprot:501098_1
MNLFALLLLSDVVLSQINNDTDMCLWGSTDSTTFEYNGLYRNTGKSYNNKTYYILTKCNHTTYLAYFDYSYVYGGPHFDHSYYFIGPHFNYSYVFGDQNFRWGISSTLSAPHYASDYGIRFCDVNGSTPDIACGETGHFVTSDAGIDPNAHITSNSKPNHIACIAPKVNCSSIHVVDTGSSECSGTFIQSHQIQDGYLRFKRQSAPYPYTGSVFVWTFNVDTWDWSCTIFDLHVVKYPSGEPKWPCSGYVWGEPEHLMNFGFEAIFSSQGLNYTADWPSTDVHNVRFTCIDMIEEHESKGFDVIIIVITFVIITIAVFGGFLDRRRKIKQQSRALDIISINGKSETQGKHELLMEQKNNNSTLSQIVNVDSIRNLNE